MLGDSEDRKRITGFDITGGNGGDKYPRLITDGSNFKRDYKPKQECVTSPYYYATGITPTVVGVRSVPSHFVKMNPHMFQMRIGSCGGLPRITVSKAAYADMCCIVAEATASEVGWVGTVKRDGMNFTVGEVFLPGQQGHAATCEITTEGLGDLAVEILKRPDGMEVWNSIRFWGHVHPGNCTSPSPQDDDQMKVFRDACPDFFIRGILGREGRMEFTAFVYDCGLIFYDVPWCIEESAEEVAERRDAWKKTLSTAVKPLYGQATVVYHYGRRVGGRWIHDDDKEWKEEWRNHPDTVGGPLATSAPGPSGGVTNVESDQILLARIKASIIVIMRWKLWRLFRMLAIESRGVVVSLAIKDVRALSDAELRSELSNSSGREGTLNRDLRWFLMSELGIREEQRFVVPNASGFMAKTADFEKEYAALNGGESYLRGPEFRQSSEQKLAALAKFRKLLVDYVRKSGIDLGMDERELADVVVPSGD